MNRTDHGLRAPALASEALETSHRFPLARAVPFRGAEASPA
jgi:hypothetical protein